MASNDPSEDAGSALPRGLLGRRGTPVGKDTRLSSLKAPRDLTLGGVRKKTYQPNIPSRRDRPKEDNNHASETVNKDNDGGKAKDRAAGDRGRGRGRGRGGRERGRGRGDVIQSHSIFEEGPGQGLKKKGGGVTYDAYEKGSTSSRPATKKEKLQDPDTQKTLDYLLRDDFVCDGRLETEDPALMPVQLPLANAGKISGNSDSKTIPIKVKDEPMEVDGDSPSTETPRSSSSASNRFSTTDQPVTVGQLFDQASKSEDGEILFLQLPDTLPGDPPGKDDDDRPHPSRTQKQDSQAKAKDPQSALNERLGLCSLSDFSEGYVGKLQVCRSGATRLILGNNTMDLAMGTPASFLQDLVSVRLNDGNGDMSVLGQISKKLICVPDLDSLLDNR